jgi:hypothetical protein
MRVSCPLSALFPGGQVAIVALCAWACGSPTAPTAVANTTITASGTDAGQFAFQVASPGHTTVTMTWANPSNRPVQFVLRVTESTLTACVTQNGLANTPCVDWTGAPTGPTSLAINADIKAPSGSGGLGSVFFQVVTYPSPYESSRGLLPSRGLA